MRRSFANALIVAMAVLRTRTEKGIPGYGLENGVWWDDIKEL